VHDLIIPKTPDALTFIEILFKVSSRPAIHFAVPGLLSTHLLAKLNYTTVVVGGLAKR